MSAGTPCSVRTCVVMPVYNEGRTIAGVLDAAGEWVERDTVLQLQEGGK